MQSLKKLLDEFLENSLRLFLDELLLIYRCNAARKCNKIPVGASLFKESLEYFFGKPLRKTIQEFLETFLEEFMEKKKKRKCLRKTAGENVYRIH